MTREEKIAYRKERAHRRRTKRNESYFNRIKAVSDMGRSFPLSIATRSYGNEWYVSGCWPDPDSPTGYSQKCSYEEWGTCQSPCNGDC